MKKPYSLRYSRTYMLRSLTFGAVILIVFIVLEYFRAMSDEKWKLYDSIIWTSFFTLGLTFCSYTGQIIVHDFLHLHGYLGRDSQTEGEMKARLLKLTSRMCGYVSFIATGAAASFGLFTCFLQEDFSGEMKFATVVAALSITCFAVTKLLLKAKEEKHN